MYIDSHAHLYFDKFEDDLAEVIERAREAGFVHVVNVGTTLDTTRQALALAQEYPGFCYSSAGIHPTETNFSAEVLRESVEELSALIDAHPKEIRAVGEIGFDFYWDYSPPEAQAPAFRSQMELAEAKNLPVIIHCREAMAETLEVVEEFRDRVRGVFHCFSGTADQAERVVELGWYVSFAGNVTYPKAPDLREAAARVGPEVLLLETDAPFLSPQPKRGKRNEPVHSLHTLEVLAEVCGMDREELGRITTRNARELFRLDA